MAAQLPAQAARARPRRRCDGAFSVSVFARSGRRHRARLAEIPPDTRTVTGILCGDPLPGRRAIDRARPR